MEQNLLKQYRQLADGDIVKSRRTFLSNVDQVAAIQLAVLLIQRNSGEAVQSLSSRHLIDIQKRIYQRKTQKPVTSLPSTPFSPDVFSPLDDVYEQYVSFMNDCNMFDAADVALWIETDLLKDNQQTENGLIQFGLCKDGTPLRSPMPRKNRTPLRSPMPGNNGTPLRSPISFNKDRSVFGFLISEEQVESLLQKAALKPDQLCATPKLNKLLPSVVHEQLWRVLLSYFQLLVNTRDEIALARVIDVPTRGIDHVAFTKIRKMASAQNLPMYQVVSSFVRCIELGGKGYQPSADNTLLRHKDGLREFMELMDELQNTMEEANTIKGIFTSCSKKIKLALIRAKVPVFTTKVVQEVIQMFLSGIHHCFEDKQQESPMDHVLTVRDFLDYLVLQSNLQSTCTSADSQLCGVLSTPAQQQGCMRRIPSLVSQFKTPDVQLDSETPKKPTGGGKTVKPIDEKGFKYGSFHWAGPVGKSLASPSPIKMKPNSMDHNTPCSKKMKLTSNHDESLEFSQPTPEFKLIRCPEQNVLKDATNKLYDEAGNSKTTTESGEQKKLLKKRKSKVEDDAEKVWSNGDENQDKDLKRKKGKSKPAIKEAKAKVVKEPKSKSSKVAKKLTLLPGQKKLTSFFTSG